MRQAGSYAVIVLLLLATGGYAVYQFFTQEPIRSRNDRPALPQTTINPNHADWASLARLPGLGPAKSQAIVAYREGQRMREPTFCFRQPEDLMAVKGIGPGTVELLRAYVSFDKDEVSNPQEGALRPD